MNKNTHRLPQRPGLLYPAVWRWHFYMGLLVIPFLLMLSASGLLMLLSKPLDTAMNQHLLSVDPGTNQLPPTSLLQQVQSQYPHASVRLYLPPEHRSDVAQFSIQTGHGSGHGGHGASSILVNLNPYTGQILGAQDPSASLYTSLKEFHGSLYLGDLGDSLIEIAAGLGVLMIVTGLYLGWPRGGWRTLIPTRSLAGRGDWRRLHVSIGWIIAIPLLFFLISGLAWTNVWGGKLVQPWGSLPGTRYEAPKAELDHASMNQSGLHQVPWALEQTPLPSSSQGKKSLELDDLVRVAGAQGFDNYRVHFPQSESGVWTVSATTIAGDLTNPGAERILHIDQSNGQLLSDIRFADYPTMGKAMAAFIPFHQGDLGLWNWILNLLLVSMVIVLIVTGATLWWKRQPRLSPPVADPARSRTVMGVMLLTAICFPLSAVALVGIIIMDILLVSLKSRNQEHI